MKAIALGILLFIAWALSFLLQGCAVTTDPITKQTSVTAQVTMADILAVAAAINARKLPASQSLRK